MSYSKYLSDTNGFADVHDASANKEHENTNNHLSNIVSRQQPSVKPNAHAIKPKPSIIFLILSRSKEKESILIKMSSLIPSIGLPSSLHNNNTYSKDNKAHENSLNNHLSYVSRK